MVLVSTRNCVRTTDHSPGVLLAQNNGQDHEWAIYYQSKKMIKAEHKYNPCEKKFLTLVL